MKFYRAVIQWKNCSYIYNMRVLKHVQEKSKANNAPNNDMMLIISFQKEAKSNYII
jgi:hypothetical protein